MLTPGGAAPVGGGTSLSSRTTGPLTFDPPVHLRQRIQGSRSHRSDSAPSLDRRRPAGRPDQASPEGRPAQASPEGRPAQASPEGRPAQASPEGRPAQASP